MIELAYKKILEEISGLHAYVSFSTGPYPALTYKVTPVNGGTVRRDQLEIRIIGEDFEELAKIRDIIINKMDMEQNQPSIDVDGYVIRSQLAGGGWLFNSDIQMWELYPIFTTMWRCKE